VTRCMLEHDESRLLWWISCAAFLSASSFFAYCATSEDSDDQSRSCRRRRMNSGGSKPSAEAPPVSSFFLACFGASPVSTRLPPALRSAFRATSPSGHVCAVSSSPDRPKHRAEAFLLQGRSRFRRTVVFGAIESSLRSSTAKQRSFTRVRCTFDDEPVPDLAFQTRSALILPARLLRRRMSLSACVPILVLQ
jgi:hypothetical protein